MPTFVSIVKAVSVIGTVETKNAVHTRAACVQAQAQMTRFDFAIDLPQRAPTMIIGFSGVTVRKVVAENLSTSQSGTVLKDSAH